MPVSWTYEPILNAFVAISTDPEPLDGLFQALDEILEHPQGVGRVRILVDHKHPPTPAIVSEGITRLLPYLYRIRGSTIVLVLPVALFVLLYLSSGTFRSLENLANVNSQVAALMIASLGQGIVAISGGIGCRGFVREDDRVQTWEVAFRLKQEVVRGPNVISLHRRRPG